MKIFNKITEKKHFKLTRLLGAAAITTALITPGIAMANEETSSVRYEYGQKDMLAVLNPFDWNFEAKNVILSSEYGDIVLPASVYEKALKIRGQEYRVITSDNNVKFDKEELKNNTDIEGNKPMLYVLKGTLVPIVYASAGFAVAELVKTKKKKK